jgi:excisionase family DNA binding protein
VNARGHAQRHLLALAVGLATSVVLPRAAAAQTLPPCERAVLTVDEAATMLRIDAKAITQLADRGTLPGRRVGADWRFSCTALLEWLAGDRRSAEPIAPVPIATSDLTAIAGTGSGERQAGSSAEAADSRTSEPQDRPVGEAPQERKAEEIFLRGQRVLLGPGDVVVDFGQFYGRRDDQVLALVDSSAGLANARQEVFTTLLQVRVGVFNETELFAGATFNRLESRLSFGSTELASDSQDELSGATLGVRRTIMREGVRRPSAILSFSGHVPRGDRPYLVGVGVVLVKSVDPAALFFNVNYLRAVKEGSSEVTLASDDSVDVSLGYALAVNDTLAVSMAVSGLFRGTVNTPDDARLREPGSFSLRFGVTSWLARGLYIEPSVSLLLSGPSRSFAFGVTLPYAF